jgi:hypothetical protein
MQTIPASAPASLAGEQARAPASAPCPTSSLSSMLATGPPTADLMRCMAMKLRCQHSSAVRHAGSSWQCRLCVRSMKALQPCRWHSSLIPPSYRPHAQVPAAHGPAQRPAAAVHIGHRATPHTRRHYHQHCSHRRRQRARRGRSLAAGQLACHCSTPGELQVGCLGGGLRACLKVLCVVWYVLRRGGLVMVPDAACMMVPGECMVASPGAWSRLHDLELRICMRTLCHAGVQWRA